MDSGMNIAFHTWKPAMKEVFNDVDEASAFSSDVEQEPAAADATLGFGSQVTIWSEEILVCCVCGAPQPYCTCLPTSLEFSPENEYFQQPPMHQHHARATNSESVFTIEPQVREDSRPTVTTRKEV
jgi:hypothetical protein